MILGFATEAGAPEVVEAYYLSGTRIITILALAADPQQPPMDS